MILFLKKNSEWIGFLIKLIIIIKIVLVGIIVGISGILVGIVVVVWVGICAIEKKKVEESWRK